ncbi:MAG: YncE family protein [Cytophagaceae bacterium]
MSKKIKYTKYLLRKGLQEIFKLIGGHRQGDTTADRDAQKNKAPGMFYFLNFKLIFLSEIQTNTGFLTVSLINVGNKVYFFSHSQIRIVDALTDTITNIIDVPEAALLRYHAKDENRIYFVKNENTGGQLMYLNIDTEELGVEEINVGTNPVSSIYFKGKLYLAARDSNEVFIVDTASFTLLETLAVTNPFSFAVDPIREKIYAFSFTNTAIRIISYASNTLIGTIVCASGTTAGRMRDAYVFFDDKIVGLSRNTGHAVIISTATDSIITNIAVGTTPSDAILYSCNLFVCNFGSSNVSVIDLSENTFITNIPVGGGPGGAGAMELYQDKIFVPCLQGSGGISIIDAVGLRQEAHAETNSLVRNILILEDLKKLYNSASNSLNSGVYQIQPNQVFYLAGNGTDWIDMTPVRKAGGILTGVIGYDSDRSKCMTEFSIPHVGFVREMIAESVVGGSSGWIEITKSRQDFSVAASSNTINIYELPAGARLEAVELVPTSRFNGGGVTDAFLSVGTSFNPLKFSREINVYDIPADYALMSVVSHKVGTSSEQVVAKLTTFGANISALTSGAITIRLKIST